MSDVSEVRAFLLRRAMGVIGPGSPRDIWNLGEYLGEAVRQTTSAVAGAGEYVYLPDGCAWIKLPILLNERRLAHVALHEYGHYLCEERSVGNTDPLDQAARIRAEYESEEFGDAFLLPREVIEALRSMADAFDLAEEFGIPQERIERRREALRGMRRLYVSGPPAWSAWPHYRVEYHRHPVLGRFRLVPTSPFAVPLEVPVAARMYAPTLRAIHWDLAALRLHEFQHKHHAGARVEIESAGMMFQELAPQRTRPRTPNRR